MCGAVHTPAAATNKLKIQWFASAGEITPTGHRGVQRRGTRRDLYTEDVKVGDDIYGDTGVLVLWDPCSVCIFDVPVVDTGAAFY